MLRYAPFAVLIALSVGVLSCANDPVIATGQIVVEVDENADFSQYQTFSVLTADIVEGEPQIDQDEMIFNETVNAMIVDAMLNEPVCLDYIRPQDVTDTNQPDVWGANGLKQSQDSGYYWECIGGWWWGFWGWWWDPCKWWRPVYVEFDVNSLLIPVGEPPAGEDPAPVFVGLAQAVATPGPDQEERVRAAVQAIFSQWPDRRTCPPRTP